MTHGAAEWPRRLNDLHDPPASLHVAGHVELLENRCVAIVGARAATHPGREIARRLARDLAAEKITVVSGMARGIDAAAHRGALEAGGPSAAVLGTGIDLCYPPESRDVYEKLAETGLLISEFIPGTPPLRAHFPQRNRLIAALAQVVVVVEGSARSGSRITADFALELGREVMAVPRDPLFDGSEMPNGLLKQGAAPVTSAADVLSALEGDPGQPARRQPLPPAVPDHVRWLWDVLAGGPLSAEEIIGATSRRPAEVMQALSELELQSLVVRAPGGLVARRGGA